MIHRAVLKGMRKFERYFREIYTQDFYVENELLDTFPRLTSTILLSDTQLLYELTCSVRTQWVHVYTKILLVLTKFAGRKKVML